MRRRWVVLAALTLIPVRLGAQEPCTVTVLEPADVIGAFAGRPLTAIRVRHTPPAAGTAIRAEPAGGASAIVLNGEARTDSTGVASFPNLSLTLSDPGADSGVVQLSLVAPDCRSRDVTVRVRVPRPAALAVLQRFGSGARGQPVAPPPVVEVRDQFGLVLSGARVVLSGSIAVAGNIAITDSVGLARFSDLAIDTVGRHVLAASVLDLAGLTDSVVLHVQQSIGSVDVTAPDSVEVGIPFGSPVRVRVGTAAGQPIRGVQVTVHLLSGPGQLETGTDAAVTDEAGQAVFGRLTIRGRPGSYRLSALAGASAKEFSVSAAAGRPVRLVILRQPPTRTRPDSVFDPPVTVAVEDTAGNGVPGVDVMVVACTEKLGELDDKSRPTRDALGNTVACRNDGPRPNLGGPAVRRTDSEGLARFDSLAVSGKGGGYYLWFCIRGDGVCHPGQRRFAQSALIRYNPGDLDRSYVVISAIKSIAGDIPNDEFFDLRFRFRFSAVLFTMAYIDLALTNRGSDSARGGEDGRLTEASLVVAGTAPVLRKGRKDNDFPDRAAFGGVIARVFNTTPYYGLHIGFLELAGSPFHGSSVVVSYVKPFNYAPFTIDGETIAPAPSLLADFFIRSSTIDFFKLLNVRGAVLIARRGQGVRSRITIAIPVGNLVDFF